MIWLENLYCGKIGVFFMNSIMLCFLSVLWILEKIVGLVVVVLVILFFCCGINF